eukprot:CAMPEP_0185156558 /NCGR_PEP_ID=MMETSP1139-20130426/1193_1 /TAXON_ID=298111 /ORGANISM="Pavlova sp., Strain CCMP459" /LENGTH=153 /DNA_ID=CAMNT_0027721561 /DNA_START=75 /DNA_END=536 /DNA_ORIENTATION=-
MRAVMLLFVCAATTASAYFDMGLIGKAALKKVESQSRQRHLRALAEADEAVEDTGENFWDRLGKGDRGPGQRAAITTMIAVAVVVVVCICCVCTPIHDIIFWKDRDDAALNETYEPKTPTRPLPQLDESERLPAAAGDDVNPPRRAQAETARV